MAQGGTARRKLVRKRKRNVCNKKYRGHFSFHPQEWFETDKLLTEKRIEVKMKTTAQGFRLVSEVNRAEAQVLKRCFSLRSTVKLYIIHLK